MILIALAAHALAATPPAAKQVLWDAWYVRSIGSLRYSYYQEIATIQKGRVHIQTHEFKREEGFINEEHIGVLAEDRADLAPVLMNGLFKYRAQTYQIDAVHKEGNRLQFTLAVPGSEPKNVTKTPQKGAFFSTHFGVWLHRLRPQKKTAFYAIREDDPKGEFPTVKGWVEPLSGQAGSYRVNYGGVIMSWTLDRDGAPSRVEIPSQGQITLRTSRAEAEKYLVDTDR